MLDDTGQGEGDECMLSQLLEMMNLCLPAKLTGMRACVIYLSTEKAASPAGLCLKATRCLSLNEYVTVSVALVLMSTSR